MASAPTIARQQGMLERLQRGMVLAGPDNPVLRHLQRRRYAQAHTLHDPRTGKPMANARAWSITNAGIAAALQLTTKPKLRKAQRLTAEQIDIEDAIASASSGDAPECAALTDFDNAASVNAAPSAPQGRPSNPALAAAKPETHHA